MNRKLHTNLMALSSTGLLLVLGLLFATPAPVPSAVEAAPVAAAAAQPVDLARAQARVQRAEARAAAMEARARVFESEVAAATDAGEALTLTAAFVAEAATTAALAAALDEVGAGASAAVEAPERSTTATRVKRRGARNSLALPYFSFARGLRRGNGG